MMNDIYLYVGCNDRASLQLLLDRFSEINTSDILHKLMESSPGLLGLSLSRDRAHALLMALGRVGAVGLYVPVSYRQPEVTPSTAQVIAEEAARAIRLTSFPGYDFNLATFEGEEAMWWVFFTSSPELVEQGHIPGGFYIYVDKLDGHIWRDEEMDRVSAIIEEMQYQ
jgi:hypothetical protein